MDPTWIVAATSLATVIAALFVWAARWGWKFTSRLSRFIDDYFGEPPSPGRPERPGVMLRMERLERAMDSVNSQVHFNTGHSMRDVVQKTSDDVSHLRLEMDKMGQRLDRMGGQP